MRVEMDGDADLFAQCLHQFESGVGLTQTRHVFDREEMRAEFFQLLGHGDEILERILRPRRVEDVAGVANGGLAHRAGFQHGVDGDAHILNRVQRIEDAEDIDPLCMRFADELLNHIVRIGGVADGVRAAQEHLEADIGNARPQYAQPLPGILVQKAHGRVERRSAPHFEAEEIRETLGHRRRRGQQVVRAHARCEQRLMRVAERRVRHQQALLFARPLREFLRPQFLQELPCARREFARSARNGRRRKFLRDLFPFHFGVAVEDYVADVGKQFGRAVRAARYAEQFRKFIEKGSRYPAGLESRMAHDILEKGIFVLTPRMRNSRSARSIRWHASGSVRPHAVVFTRSES